MHDVQTLTVYSRNDFRKWLKKNHRKESRIAIIVHKRHTQKPAPTHRELIEEAICFGWIDTTIKRIDNDTFLRNFTKRNSNSRWSDNTLKYAKQLIRDGRMTSEGLYFYRLGLAKPTHDYGIPKNPDMPSELKEALLKNKKAEDNFETFPLSTKRGYYRWLLRAKLPETKLKRVKQIVKYAILKNKDFLRPNSKINS